MKSSFVSMLRDRRGTTFEGIALSVAIVAVAFVASADMLDYLLKKHNDGGSQVAMAVPASTAGNLDVAPTGSLPKLISRSVLDPCTGVVK